MTFNILGGGTRLFYKQEGLMFFVILLTFEDFNFLRILNFCISV